MVSEGGEIIEESELMDKKIAQIPGVELIISCLTGTKSNNNRAASSQEDVNSITIRKGLAYFIVTKTEAVEDEVCKACLLYTSPSPRDATLSRMPSSA